jgi:hypothetical protein
LRLLVTKSVSVLHRKESIVKNCDFEMELHVAYDHAKLLCENQYGSAPELIVEGRCGPFPYIQGHLYHILFEMFKNSLEATVAGPRESHPIRVNISQAKVVTFFFLFFGNFSLFLLFRESR